MAAGAAIERRFWRPARQCRGEISRHSLRVYDGRTISVGGSGRTVSGTAEAAPKVGGPVCGARQILGRTKTLRPPVWPVFLSDAPNELYSPFYNPLEML